MRQRMLLTLAALLLVAATLPAQSVSVVDTDLGERMTELFPGLSEGYIDLNSNGQLDRFQDMDEKVPESHVQDNILQVQEILDFIIDHFRFFTVERLQEVHGIGPKKLEGLRPWIRLQSPTTPADTSTMER